MRGRLIEANALVGAVRGVSGPTDPHTLPLRYLQRAMMEAIYQSGTAEVGFSQTDQDMMVNAVDRIRATLAEPLALVLPGATVAGALAYQAAGVFEDLAERTMNSDQWTGFGVHPHSFYLMAAGFMHTVARFVDQAQNGKEIIWESEAPPSA